MNDNQLSVMPPPEGGSEYPLLTMPQRELLEIFRDNLGDAGLAALDLSRVKVPSGGSLSWNVKTPDGEESVKEIEGIVLSWQPKRIYWEKSLNEGGGKKPPDCTSADGFIGIGNPGGRCNQCPKAQFGSAKQGHGQACKQVRQMLLVRPGEILPMLISVPPTSLKAMSQYFLGLTGRQIPYWAVTTKMRLERDKNEGGIEYAKVAFFQGRVLTPKERDVLRPFHERMQVLLAPLAIDSRDYAEEAPRPPRSSDPPFYSGPAGGPPPPHPSDDDIPF
jgi:hypothetical protein